MKRSTIILIVALLVAVAASFLFGCVVGRKFAERPGNRPDTIYINTWRPQPIEKPKDSLFVKTKLVFLPVPLPVHDTIPVHDTTAVRDSVLVEVPIVEKVFPGENYRAVVRGFNPELVDIWVKERETIIKVPYRERWSVTVGPQAGVGITPKGVQPYLGVGGAIGYSFSVKRKKPSDRL